MKYLVIWLILNAANVNADYNGYHSYTTPNKKGQIIVDENRNWEIYNTLEEAQTAIKRKFPRNNIEYQVYLYAISDEYRISFDKKVKVLQEIEVPAVELIKVKEGE